MWTEATVLWLSKDGIKSSLTVRPVGSILWHSGAVSGGLFRQTLHSLFYPLSRLLYLPFSTFVFVVAFSGIFLSIGAAIRKGKAGEQRGKNHLQSHTKDQSLEIGLSPPVPSLPQFRLETCPDITVEGMTGMRGIPGHSHLGTVSSEWEGHSLICRESSMKKLMDDQWWWLFGHLLRLFL